MPRSRPLEFWTNFALVGAVYMQFRFILVTILRSTEEVPAGEVPYGVPWDQQVIALVAFVLYLVLRSRRDRARARSSAET